MAFAFLQFRLPENYVVIKKTCDTRIAGLEGKLA